MTHPNACLLFVYSGDCLSHDIAHLYICFPTNQNSEYTAWTKEEIWFPYFN